MAKLIALCLTFSMSALFSRYLSATELADFLAGEAAAETRMGGSILEILAPPVIVVPIEGGQLRGRFPACR